MVTSVWSAVSPQRGRFWDRSDEHFREVARPVLAAFIHPTINAVSDIPRLAWMWMKLQDRGYNLLHAKVALLGFRRRGGEGYVIRLAVSTGNWTQDPLTDSIDLSWLIDVDTASNKQDVADIRAAQAMFNWLKERADCSLIERDYDGHRPDVRLETAIDALPTSDTHPVLSTVGKQRYSRKLSTKSG